jgi:DNA-nicking Smr family endonuclease
VLRQEMRRYLANHTLVRSFSAADGAHGGIGATEVFLNNY